MRSARLFALRASLPALLAMPEHSWSAPKRVGVGAGEPRAQPFSGRRRLIIGGEPVGLGIARPILTRTRHAGRCAPPEFGRPWNASGGAWPPRRSRPTRCRPSPTAATLALGLLRALPEPGTSRTTSARRLVL